MSGSPAETARTAMVRARAALQTAASEKPCDLLMPARKRVIARRIAELTEAIAAIDARLNRPGPGEINL